MVVAVVAEQAKAEDAPPVEPSVHGPRVFRVGAARSAPTAAAAQATRPAVTKHKRRLAVRARFFRIPGRQLFFDIQSANHGWSQTKGMSHGNNKNTKRKVPSAD